MNDNGEMALEFVTFIRHFCSNAEVSVYRVIQFLIFNNEKKKLLLKMLLITNIYYIVVY